MPSAPLAAPDSFGSSFGRLAMWFVLIAVLAGLFGLTDNSDGQAAELPEVLGSTTEDRSSNLQSVEFDSASLNPDGPEAKNAKSFLKVYYQALLDSSQRQRALNTMLTPEFRQSVNPASVNAFWDSQQTTSVSEVVPESSTRFKATVTHVPFGSHAVPQHMEFDLVCAVRVSTGEVCRAEDLLMASALHLDHGH